MTPIRRACVAAAITVAGLLGILAAPGRDALSAQAPDPVAREVRELRQTLARDAALLVRAQLAGQRAVAAQARLSSVSWDLADLRAQLARASGEVARYSSIISDVEREYPNIASDAGFAMRMPAYSQARGQLEAQRRVEATLREREAVVAEALRTEERRWQEALARLDALERELGPNRQ